MKQQQFKKIVNNNKDLIYNQAFYFSANKEDAEDITQEVLIKLWHNINYIKPASLKAWILKVTHNLCIDYSRKKKEQIITKYSGDTSQSDIFETLVDLQSNPERETINKDLMEKIIHVINQLPEKIKSIVILRDIQDLKYELIAETVELPLNSVKVYLHRGRKILIKNLKRYFKHDFQSE